MRLSAIEKSSLLLLALAVLILTAVTFVQSSGIVEATLILIAFACFMAGLFTFTFRKREQVDASTASLMATPYRSTTSRLLSDLGVSGAAAFVPVSSQTFPSPVMQFNPVSGFQPVALADDTSFLAGPGGAGALTVPSGWPLFSHLSSEKALTVPGSEPDLFAAIRETAEDLLEVSDAVTVTRSGEEIAISLRHFLLIAGCQLAREESPRTCALAPCPVCSLFGMMLALGTGKPVSVSQVLTENDRLEVRFREEAGEAGDMAPALKAAESRETAEF